MYLLKEIFVSVLSLMGNITKTFENPEHNERLYQGDIVLSPSQTNSLHQRKAIDSNRWPADVNGTVVVPFAFNPTNTTSKMRNVTRVALKMWEDATCISFQEHPSLIESVGHIYFEMTNPGCYSAVGSQGELQKINIGDNCDTVGVVAHEAAHALGFLHEQARSDRDQFVEIVESNIKPSMTGNFQKSSSTINTVKYDYASIMHYSDTTFSINRQATILTINPLYQKLIGQRQNLSFRDLKTMNLHYKCADAFKCGEDTCQNEGYLGKRCTCVCPPGTSGNKCETQTEEYTKAILDLLQPSSGTVRSEGPFTSPNYPDFPAKRPGFVQVVESTDECEDVEVTVGEFDLPGCGASGLTITTSRKTSGITPLCGTSSSKVVVKGPKVIFTYSSNWNSWFTVKGYKGNVKFVRKSECHISPTPSSATTETASVPTDTPITTTASPDGVNIINTGSDVKLELAENKCNFQLQEIFNSTFELSTIISGPLSNFQCMIQLSTIEPRVIKIVQITGLNNTTVTTNSDSILGNNNTFSSNVDVLFSGNNPEFFDNKVTITLELVNYECQKVVLLGDQASGIMSIGNDPCEVWFKAPPGRRIKAQLHRTPSSSASTDCDTNGFLWLSAFSDHTIDGGYRWCANRLPPRVLAYDVLNLRSVHSDPDTAPITVHFRVE